MSRDDVSSPRHRSRHDAALEPRSSTKTAACSRTPIARIVSTARAPGWVEHDAAEIWTQYLRGDRGGRSRARRSRGSTRSRSRTRARPFSLFDRETGEPLHHALVWQDLRDAARDGALARDAEVARRVTETTGLRLDSYFSAGKIRWLLDQRAARRGSSLARGRLAIGTIDAYLMHRLTGGQSFVTDASTAARTLLFDIHDESLRSVAARALRRAARSVARGRGTASERSGQRRSDAAADAIAGTPILVGLVDQPAAMIGHACLDEGEIKATYGTGCFVYRNTGARRAHERARAARARWRGDATARPRTRSTAESSRPAPC